jgi:glycine betaine/proline transport system permease protein
VRWINVNFFDQLEAVKNAMLLNVLLPVKRFLLALPWPWVLALVSLAGWQLGGWRLAAALPRARPLHRRSTACGKRR